jgi:hypothetical protein
MFSISSIMRRPLLLAPFAGMFPARTQAASGPGLADAAAETLAGLIGDARREAIAGGVKPLPPSIRSHLLGYFPASLLDRCRYAAGGTRRFSLPGLAFRYGDTTAMTLGEVVLFKDEAAARSNLKTWAHELTHVMQYQRWGLDGFASRYVRDSQTLEQEARDNAGRFMSWSRKAA